MAGCHVSVLTTASDPDRLRCFSQDLAVSPEQTCPTELIEEQTSSQLTPERIRIILADDNPKILNIVTKLLEPAFDVVAAVNNGYSALEAASRLNPDLFILDIVMPVLNGLQAATQMKEVCSGPTNIIFLTAYYDADFLEACFKCGARGYVLKTRVVTDLLIAIREVLAGRTFISRSSQQSQSPS